MAYLSMENLTPELVNLAEKLDERELENISSIVLEEYRADEESRQDWLRLHSHWMRLYFQRDASINPPWPGSSQESLPLLTEACNQFGARAYKAFFPNRNIFKAIPTGKASTYSLQRAKRVAQHMSWQLLVQDRSYKRNKDRLLLGVSLHGHAFTKVYYDPHLHRIVHRNVRAEDLVLPYGTGPRDMEEIERKTEIIWMSVNDTKIRQQSGYFIAHAEPWEGEIGDTDTQRVASQAEGLTVSSQLRDRGRAKILEQHRLLDLDEDGIAEPYVVTLDAQSEKVLRVSVRYETDDLGRPTYSKRPIEYYTSWAFIENPDGVYGLGMGHLIGGLNSSVNKLLRQTIDSGTLANIGNMSGFISKQLSVKKGQLEVELGKFTALENSTENIQQGIFQFKFPGPTNVLPELAELLMTRSDRLATTTEALTGQTDAVQQPTTILALIDQGLEMFSSIYERLFSSWDEELNKHYALNGKYLDEDEYFAVIANDGAIEDPMAQVGRADYAPDMRIVPIVDAKMANEKKRLAKAQQVYEVATTNPLIMQNPQSLHAATRYYLEALELEEIDRILPPLQMMMPQPGMPGAPMGPGGLPQQGGPPGQGGQGGPMQPPRGPPMMPAGNAQAPGGLGG